MIKIFDKNWKLATIKNVVADVHHGWLWREKCWIGRMVTSYPQEKLPDVPVLDQTTLLKHTQISIQVEEATSSLWKRK